MRNFELCVCSMFVFVLGIVGVEPVFMLDDHTVDLGFFWVLSDQNALEVVVTPFLRERFLDLLKKSFVSRFANDCETLLSIEKHSELRLTHRAMFCIAVKRPDLDLGDLDLESRLLFTAQYLRIL